MRRTKTRRALARAVFALALLSASLPAPAGTLRDDGGFFSPQTEQRVTQALDRIQKRHGKNVVVETYQAPTSSVPTAGDERSRNAAYDQWMQRRGRELNADVLILVTRNPSHVQAGSSQAMQSSGAFTANDHRQTAEMLLPKFRQRQFDEGIIQAVEFIDRRLAQNIGPERNNTAGAPTPSESSRSGASGGQSSPSSPPPPGGSNRPSAPQGMPTGLCGGGGSLLCLLVIIVGAVLLFRSFMSRRSNNRGGVGQPGYGQGPYGGQPGYGQPGFGRGGGFGAGLGGGLLGGLLGGWLMNRTAHGGGLGGGLGSDPNAAGGSHPAGLPPTDPSTFDTSGGFSSSGGDFGGGGGDFGGGGGDSGSSSGGDF